MKAINFGFVSVSARNKMPSSAGGRLEWGVFSNFAIIAGALPISLYLMAEKSPSVSPRCLACWVCWLLAASCKNGGKLPSLFHPLYIGGKDGFVPRGQISSWPPIADVNQQALDTTKTRDLYDVVRETFDFHHGSTNSIVRKPGLPRVEGLATVIKLEGRIT